MKEQNEEFKQRVYDLMNGNYNLEACDYEESNVVEDEFAEEKYCEELYGEMLAAYASVCRRLHQMTGEDKDVEVIINNLLNIGRYQCMKMFDYGAFFSRKENVQ